jgi:hypothetical protein
MEACLRFEGVETNADGLIAEADLLALFDGAIGAYGDLAEDYPGELDLAA